MDLTYRKLRELSDDKVVDMYDAEAERVETSLNFLRDELLRREQARQAAAMENQAAAMARLTWWIFVMTVVVTVATVINVVIAVQGQP